MGRRAAISEGMKTLLSEVSDAVVLADSQGRVSFMNPRAEKLTGLTSDEACEMELWEACVFLDGSTGNNLRKSMEEALNRDGFFSFPPTTVLVRGEGDDKPVTGGVFMSDEKGTGTDSIEGLVFRDVSREWIVNPYVRKQQNADTLMVLAGCIRNNLNDLLTVLLSNLSMISRNSGDSSALFRYVRDSKKMISKISSMFSSLSTGLSGSREEDDVCLVENVIRRVTSIFRAANPEVALELAYPRRTGLAAISGELLEQVLLNLLNNAFDAAGQEGSIGLAACRIDLDREFKPLDPGAYVMVSVKDDGCGIPEDELNRIFQPFYSTHGEKKGLGLSAVYSIVDEYGGYVMVDSRVDEGAVFTVFLPSSEGFETESAEDPLPAAVVAGFEETEEEMLSAILESIGCSVSRTVSSKSSVEPDVSPEGDCHLLLADYDYVMTKLDMGENGTAGRKNLITVIDESWPFPDHQDLNARYLTRPLKLEKIASAVAECCWRKDRNAGGEEQ